MERFFRTQHGFELAPELPGLTPDAPFRGGLLRPVRSGKRVAHIAIGHCQTNLNRPAKGAGRRRLGRQLTPLGQCGGTVLSEDVAAIEVTVLIEMIKDRGVDGGKLLQSLYVPELRHRTLSSSERLM